MPQNRLWSHPSQHHLPLIQSPRSPERLQRRSRNLLGGSHQSAGVGVRRSRARVVLMIVPLTSLGILTSPVGLTPAVAAEPACGTFYKTLQAGYYSNFWSGSQPEQFEGASINFTNLPPTPVLCNNAGSGNSSSAYAMWASADGGHYM